MAQLLNWRPLPSGILDTFVPERRPDRYSGWFVADVRAFVIILEGIDDNRRRYRGCSVFLRETSPQEVISEFVRRYRVNNPYRESDGFQNYIHFRISVSGVAHQMIITFAEGEQKNGTLMLNTLVFY
jgi:hypothetical protein